MKKLVSSLLGFTLILCLLTGCDLLNFDSLDKDLTEQAPGGGGGNDEEPCKDNCRDM